MSKQGSFQRYDFETRKRAVRLVIEEGWSTADVSQSIGCSLRTVQHWVRKSQSGTKLHQLQTPPPPGAPCKLTKVQKKTLTRLLTAGPEKSGFTSQLWTSKLVRQLIENRFQVDYHECYIPRLLKQLNFSRQQPQRRASERDDKAIAAWRQTDWPRIKKKQNASTPS